MAVRSKMSTARSRGRAVVKTTTPKNGEAKTLPTVNITGKRSSNISKSNTSIGNNAKDISRPDLSNEYTTYDPVTGKTMLERTGDPKNDKYYGQRHPNSDMRIADIPSEDRKLLRKQLRLAEDEDLDISQSMYEGWVKNKKQPTFTPPGNKSREELGEKEYKRLNPYSQSFSDYGFTDSLNATIKKRDKEEIMADRRADLREASKKVKPVGTKKAIDQLKTKKDKNIEIKGKAAEEDIMVPEYVEGPKGRTKTKTKSKIGVGYKPTLARKLNLPMKQRKGRVGTDKTVFDDQTGKAKPTTNYSRRGLVKTTTLVTKAKNARLSEKMKYKKEEKLAGARERVLGMSGVALEDQVNKYGQDVKRGEKLNQGSAQRLKEIKNLYASGDDWKMKVDKLDVSKDAGKGGIGKRTEVLKGAKADIKEVGKLSRGQVKGIRSERSAKGRAMSNAKAMKAEYKSEKKPVKFSKDDTVEVTAKKVAAAKERKTPAQLKEMKTAYKSATKEARGMTRTKEEKAATRSAIKATRGIAKEARSYKGDVRKGLRMEKRDALAMKVADKTSEAKKAKKIEKGRTMRGTGYFSMSELNKTIPLSKAANVDKYKEAKLTRSEKKKLSAVGKVLESDRLKKSKARDYSSSQGKTQAGTQRFIRK